MLRTICGIDVEITRKSVKNITIRVNRAGQVFMTVPHGVAQSAADGFFVSKIGWIRNRIDKAIVPLEAADLDGREIFFFGYPVKIAISGSDGAVSAKDGVLTVGAEGFSAKRTAALIDVFLSRELSVRAEDYFRKWIAATGLAPQGVKIKKARSRWGSCNVVTKEITLSSFLADLPEFCLDYVVLHELAHLTYADHGAGFRMFLTHYMPEWKSVRAYMNKNGERMRFEYRI